MKLSCTNIRKTNRKRKSEMERKKKNVIDRGARIRIAADFSSETM